MPAVLPVTFYSKDGKERAQFHGSTAEVESPASLPKCWTLPTVILSSCHHSVPNERVNPLIFHERIATALDIRAGEEVSFSFRDSRPQNNNNDALFHCYDYDDCPSDSSYASYGNRCHNNNNLNNNHSPTSVAESWLRQGQSNRDDVFSLRVSIDPTAPFDVAIDSRHPDCNSILDGMVHYNDMGNFLCLTDGTLLKLCEQSPRVFASRKSSNDYRCAGMLVQVDGVTDYYNHRQDGAGCGFLIHASTPLAHHPRPSELMVQGYRYLGTCRNPHEAIYYALLEALQWVFRLDFQTVWIVGSVGSVFQQIQEGSNQLPPVSAITGDDDDDAKVEQLKQHVRQLLDQARQLRIQFKFLVSNDTGDAVDLATRAIAQRRNETWCHWSTINYQSQRNLTFCKTLARQVSI